MALSTQFERAEARLKPRSARVLHVLAVTAGRNGVRVCVTPVPDIIVVASGGSPPAPVTKPERHRAIEAFLAEVDGAPPHAPQIKPKKKPQTKPKESTP